jgi:hypothetical protein
VTGAAQLKPKWEKFWTVPSGGFVVTTGSTSAAITSRTLCPKPGHDGRIAVDERNRRWCSNGFEIGCDNGERVSPSRSIAVIARP